MLHSRIAQVGFVGAALLVACDNTSHPTSARLPAEPADASAAATLEDAAVHREPGDAMMAPVEPDASVAAADTSDAALTGCGHPAQAPFPPEALASCPGCAGGAHCVPRSFVEASAPSAAARLAPCDQSDLCVPDPIIATLGAFTPESCRSLHDAEGRCLSECLPEVATGSSVLPRDRCGPYERCVPCFDPVSGQDTGACKLLCDPGPSEPARLFASCCGGAGVCVPPASVAADQQALLGPDSCADPGQLCVPSMLAEPSAQPAGCSSLAGAEGRCLPTCLRALGAVARELPSAGCGAGEACVPCTDPFSGRETQACRIHGDAPKRAALVFQDCCGGLGACVARDLVNDADEKLLTRDQCSAEDALCVPRAFADPSSEPPSCRSLADAEGRCLPACLLSAVAHRDALPRDTCASGELCAPCFNPIDASATGACTLHGDAPREPPERFDTACCGTSGLCIPSSLAGAAATHLPPDRCADTYGAGWLCAPKDVVADPSKAQNPFNSCKMNVLGLVEAGRGKCLPRCLVDTQNWVQKLLSRGSCESGELCVPCALGDVPGC